MADGFNKAILIGNLGADPELRLIQGGRAMLRFRIATHESYRDKSGEREQRTDWHTIVVWGKRAEGLHRILSKGRRVGVEGSIRHRQWEDREGHKRTSTEIHAAEVVLLDSRREADRPAEEGAARDAGMASPDAIPF